MWPRTAIGSTTSITIQEIPNASWPERISASRRLKHEAVKPKQPNGKQILSDITEPTQMNNQQQSYYDSLQKRILPADGNQ